MAQNSTALTDPAKPIAPPPEVDPEIALPSTSASYNQPSVSSKSTVAKLSHCPDDPPTPEFSELQRDLDCYDEATLDRMLKKLADRAEAATSGAQDRDKASSEVHKAPPSPPPTLPPRADPDRPISLSDRLLAIFPDACPDWVRDEAAKFQAETAGPADIAVDPEPLVSRWLTHGYRKRVKKWRQSLQAKQIQGGLEGQRTSLQMQEAAAEAPDPDEGTLFDWRRRRQDIQLRQPVFDALAQEFPLVAMRSVSQVVKAFKYCLPAAYRLLFKSLALTGHLAAVGNDGSGNASSTVSIQMAAAAAAASGDPTFARLPFDCPQSLEIRSSHRGAAKPDDDASSGVTMMPSLRRRPSELERQHPELLAELRFVRSLLADDAELAAMTDANAAAALPPYSSADPGAPGTSGGGATSTSQEHQLPQPTCCCECECCFGDFPFDAMCQCPDGHLFCRACLASYVRETVFGTGRLLLTCLAPGCEVAFLRSQLRLAVDAVTLAKLDERVAEDSVRSLSALFRCPTCGWGAEIEEDLTAGSKVFTCHNCEKEVCRLCGVDWEEHFGRRCSEIERDTETQLRREFEERMTQAKVRTCHQCQASVLKTSGCNHVTCRCGAHFCYVCRQPLNAQDPYSHFCNHPDPRGCNCGRCPVQSSTEEDEQRAIREIRAQGQKRQREEGLQERPIGAPDRPPKRSRRDS